jgi:hypothetical protein
MRFRTTLLVSSVLALMLVFVLQCAQVNAQFDAPAAGQEGDAPAKDAPAAGEEGQPAQEPGEQPAQPAEGEAGEEEAPEPALEPVPANFDFEGEEVGPYWFNTAQDGAVTITRQPADVREGQGALEFRYMPSEGAFALIGATPVKPEGPAKSLKFSFKTDEVSAILYGVNEEDGSSYQGYCYTPGGEWHDVLVDLEELILSEDTEDENGKLDPEQISTVIVADLCNLPGEVGRALGIKRGVQRMLLDNVKLTDRPAPKRSSRTADGTTIVDDFDANLVTALPIGAPDMATVPGARAGDRALRVGYRLGGHRWVGFVHAAGYLGLAGASHFCFSLNAAQRARLVAVLEERDGSKYETNLELDPAKGWHEVVLPVAQFVLDPKTEDENGQVDLEQIRVIILVIDTFNASVDAEGQGSYTVSKLYFR